MLMELQFPVSEKKLVKNRVAGYTNGGRPYRALLGTIRTLEGFEQKCDNI